MINLKDFPEPPPIPPPRRIKEGLWGYKIVNQKEIDEWDKKYGNKA